MRGNHVDGRQRMAGMLKKTIQALIICLAVMAGPGHSEAFAAQLRLLMPANGETVSMINGTTNRYLQEYLPGDGVGPYRGTKLHYSRPLTLKWKALKGRTGKYIITLGENRELTQGRFQLESRKPSCSVTNLKTGTTYYWRVRVRCKKGWMTSETRMFTTAPTVRLLSVKGVINVRDLGGGKTAGGRQIKQGMVYRSGHLDRIKPAGREMMLSRLGIRTELDLRKIGQGRAGRGSVLGSRIRYIQMAGVQYEQVWENESRSRRLADEMRVFAGESNYPILFHCIYGRDRTGTLAFMLEALLGVSEEDIYRDYELTYLTTYGVAGLRKNAEDYLARFHALYEYMNAYPAAGEDADLSERCAAFLIDHGMRQEEIDSIRSILLE